MLKEMKWFQFKPSRELWFVLLTWCLVICMFYLSFQMITTKRVALQFITFGILGIVGLGIFVPALWINVVMKRSLAIIGIKKRHLLPSIGLGVVFTLIQINLTLKPIALPDFRQIVPLLSMVLAVGLFENIFFRGWVQQRMEACFGIIPSIVMSGAMYSLYHVGYGMQSNEMVTLFIVGLVYGTIFRLTTNIFILYPFLTPSGALFTLLNEGLILPFEATYGFVDVIILSIVVLVFINKNYKKHDIMSSKTSETLKIMNLSKPTEC